jgi:inositol-hexakisphosphate 5-kinase
VKLQDGRILNHLKLENLTYKFKKPCLLDIKMGKFRLSPDSSKEKIEKSRRKYPFLEELGCKICGMKVWNQKEKVYKFFDSKYGLTITPSNIIDKGFLIFFENGTGVRMDLIELFLKKLIELYVLFEKQKSYSFISSSLLLIYEGEGNDLNFEIKIIDFDRVLDSNSIDSSFLFGLNTIINCFNDILC